jgi:zona occludens toxin (predicted ATPase)
MDTLVYGKKGSGKSYYAAYKISELKEPDKVLHNIKGLKIGININEEAENLGLRPVDFFRDCFHNKEDSPLFDDRFLKYRGFLFVIDEATDIFPDTFKDPDVFKFFRMSRHYVIDVILITQFLDILCKKIYLHAELHIKALPDISNPIPGYFIYHEMAVSEKGYAEKVGVQKLRKKKAVFDSYESADYSAASPRKKPKPMVLLLVFAVIISLTCFLGFGWFLKQRKAKMEERNEEKYSQTSTTNDLQTERKRIYNQSNSSQSEGSYPESMIDKLGGVFMPVSTFRDRKGINVIILGVPYLISNSPFPVHQSRLGYVVLVPVDIYNFEKAQKEKEKQDSGYDPNEKYYYTDSGSSNAGNTGKNNTSMPNI